ncbi:protein lifeguard 4-like [Tubulanus polymorphus]|uniref:protein lifeguard 4-like n=1 Tax=Tubulanus polymorphus TaxID=672921 RepID=UPI003DA3551A
MFGSNPLLQDDHPDKSKTGTTSGSSIVDDFMYGSNVAQCHIYIRMGFLRKVYGILSVQLLVTTLVGAFFMFCEPVKNFVQHSQLPLMSAMLLTFVLIFALMLKRNETPTNYILLAAFTLAESYLIGTIVTFYDKVIVLEAFVLTLAVTSALTVYTLQSKKDFSSWGAGLFAVLWVLILAGLIQMFFPHNKMLELGLSIGGAVLFSLFIIFDTNMMMHKLSPEEYICAAINLYLDILNLFLYILRILQASRNN